jgi:hypothetical protein
MDYVLPQSQPANIQQATEVAPHPGDTPSMPRSTVVDAYGMPRDMVLPVSDRNGVMVPATATETGIPDYDPWIWALPARILDDSRPQFGPYGEPSLPGKAGSIVAEWGGQPCPVRDYQDVTAAVGMSQRQMSYHTSSGPAGVYHGGQQTAWEASTQTPVGDYWSTIILGGH